MKQLTMARVLNTHKQTNRQIVQFFYWTKRTTHLQDRQKIEQKNRQTDRQKMEQTNRSTEHRTDKQTNRHTFKCTNVKMDNQTNRQNETTDYDRSL